MAHQSGYSRWAARFAQEAELERGRHRRDVRARKRETAVRSGKATYVRPYCRRPPTLVDRFIGKAKEWGF